MDFRLGIAHNLCSEFGKYSSSDVEGFRKTSAFTNSVRFDLLHIWLNAAGVWCTQARYQGSYAAIRRHGYFGLMNFPAQNPYCLPAIQHVTSTCYDLELGTKECGT